MKPRLLFVINVFVLFGALFFWMFSASNAVPSSAAREKTFGANAQSMVESFDESVQNKYEDVQSQLQDKFEREVDSIIRSQDDFERNMAIGSQVLETKKHLSKKERKKLLNSYKPMPKTVEEYKTVSKDIKRSERRIPTPELPKDDKLVSVPEPRYVLEKYNNPPGTQNIDLRNLNRLRQIRSKGVISPLKDKLAYTSVYYSGYNDKVSSEVFYIDLDTSKPLKERTKMATPMNRTEIKLLETGMRDEYPTLFKTLTILDWSADGNKLAVKERIGSSTFGIWQTNLWVYDLSQKKAKRLIEVRDAIKYWWKTNKNFDVDDYRWDIVPLGWDAENPDRIFVCAYAYTTKKAVKFLGIFSVDYQGLHSEMVSIYPRALTVSQNGLVLKPVNN